MRQMLLTAILLVSMSVISHAAQYTYYVPYIQAQTGQWSGLGLRNMENTPAKVTATIYSQLGDQLEQQIKTLGPYGQIAFLVGESKRQNGWALVVSDKELSGLAFAGSLTAPEYMFDIPISSTLCKFYALPHVAEEQMWRSYILLCNPNNGWARITLEFRDTRGLKLYTKQVVLKPRQSTRLAVRDVVQDTEQPGGSFFIKAELPVSAFALYSGLEDNRVAIAGITGVCRTEAETDLPPEVPGALEKSKWLLGSWVYNYSTNDKPMKFDFTFTKLEGKNEAGGYNVSGKAGARGQFEAVGAYYPDTNTWEAIAIANLYPDSHLYNVFVFDTKDGINLLPGSCLYGYTHTYNRTYQRPECTPITGRRTVVLSVEPTMPKLIQRDDGTLLFLQDGEISQ